MNKAVLTKLKSDKEAYEKHLTKLCEFKGFKPPFGPIKELTWLMALLRCRTLIIKVDGLRLLFTIRGYLT